MACAPAHHLIVDPMAPSLANPIWYVYGIVPANAPLPALPQGVDDAEVAVESVDGIAALVSVLDGRRYDASVMDANSGDLQWLGPRAMAHDLVLTRVSDSGAGAVVPLPMFSLFSSRAAVLAMLGERASQLELTLRELSAGREFALRVYRVDREFMEVMTELSPRLADLARTAAAASAGQRYLLDRKLAAEKKNELRGLSQRIADDIVTELSVAAVRHVRSPIPRASDSDATKGTMVLNTAFLVSAKALDDFKSILTSLIERHGAYGFRFDFTGPWPPYHFAREVSRGE